MLGNYAHSRKKQELFLRLIDSLPHVFDVRIGVIGLLKLGLWLQYFPAKQVMMLKKTNILTACDTWRHECVALNEWGNSFKKAKLHNPIYRNINTV